MTLKTNNTHKKIDLTTLSLEKAKRLAVNVGAFTLSVLMLSGCTSPKDKVENEDVSTQIITEVNEETVPDMMDEEILKELSDNEYVISIESDSNNEIYEEEETNISYNIPAHNPSDTIKISDMYFVVFDDGRTVTDSTYTYDDLMHITDITIILKDGEDYFFLNYMPNLEKIYIMDRSEELVLTNIDGKRFNKSLDVTVERLGDKANFSASRYGFLKQIPKIYNLKVGSSNNAYILDSEFLQSLTNVHNMSIGLDVYSNFHYQDLSFLDSLNLDGLPYDVAMYFDSDDMNSLTGAGVNVITQNMDKLKEILTNIADIISNLNITSESSNQEKLNAILIYVLTEYTYDPEVSALLAATGDVSDIDYDKFYGQGYMTGGFENDTQICGNYATIVSALSHSLGLNTYTLFSVNHAWNLVQIGDYYYYVDATALDGESMYGDPTVERTVLPDGREVVSQVFRSIPAEEIFASNNQEAINTLTWYLIDPTEAVDNGKETHKLKYSPYGIEIREIPDDVEIKKQQADKEDNISIELPSTEVEEETTISDNENIGEIILEEDTDISDIASKRFEVKINGKAFIIGGAMLVGILSGLGIAVAVKKKKDKERLRKMRSQSSYSSWNYDSFQSSTNFYQSSGTKRR